MNSKLNQWGKCHQHRLVERHWQALAGTGSIPTWRWVQQRAGTPGGGGERAPPGPSSLFFSLLELPLTLFLYFLSLECGLVASGVGPAGGTWLPDSGDTIKSED